MSDHCSASKVIFRVLQEAGHCPKRWGERALESFFLPVEVKENLEVILSYDEAGHSPVKLFELKVSYSEVILLVDRLSLT